MTENIWKTSDPDPKYVNHPAPTVGTDTYWYFLTGFNESPGSVCRYRTLFSSLVLAKSPSNVGTRT